MFSFLTFTKRQGVLLWGFVVLHGKAFRPCSVLGCGSHFWGRVFLAVKLLFSLSQRVPGGGHCRRLAHLSKLPLPRLVSFFQFSP